MEMAQSAIDMNRSAAQKYLDDKMPALTGGGLSGDYSGSVASIFAQVAHDLNAPFGARLALFMAGIVESGMQNLSYGEDDSTGALQVRASTAGPMGIDPRNVAEVAHAFLTRGFYNNGGAISLANQGYPAGDIAQMVQGSAYPSRYAAVKGQAKALLARYFQGLQLGGIIGSDGPSISNYLGAFEQGGVLPSDGFYYGHKGEAVVPMQTGGAAPGGFASQFTTYVSPQRSGPGSFKAHFDQFLAPQPEPVPGDQALGGGNVIVEGDLVVNDEQDADAVARKLAWQVSGGC